MGKCRICGDHSTAISSNLGVCIRCLRENPEEALKVAAEAHAEARRYFGLPENPPQDEDGIECGMCANDCRIGVGRKGFCGLVVNENGRLIRLGGTVDKGILEWYYDPLPTNCVAEWFCPGCTGAGYPKYAYKPSAEHGYVNLAVFYGACSFDCLFCQNWHYKELTVKLRPRITARELASKVNEKVSCICFFGGDPSVQMPHAIGTSRIALENARDENRILRICWETNGNLKWSFAREAAELSLQSGGIVKFDIKAWDDNIHRALCGVSNEATLRNFRMIGERYFEERSEVPLLTASTLLVPGYVDAKEVESIAKFIAEIRLKIPYSLLAFYPQFRLNDLPTTSRRQALECFRAAKRYLENVWIGNIHLLS